VGKAHPLLSEVSPESSPNGFAISLHVDKISEEELVSMNII
jgi:hypothetical protein